MGWETESQSKLIGSTIADTSIGGGSSNYTDDAEVLLIKARSDTWYIGAQNESSSSDSDFFIGLSDSEDGIFHITNGGVIGIGTSSPSSSYKVDIDGTLNATALTVAGVAVASSTSTYWTDSGSKLTYGAQPVDITNATDASDASGDTGALMTEGGVSIAKKLYVGTDLDVDGTTNLDAVDIDGAVQIDAAVTVGVNDTGYDVKFFGATASKYMMWDESENELLFGGASGIKFDTSASFIEMKASDSTALYLKDSGTTYVTFDTSSNIIEIDNAKLRVSQDIEINTAHTLSISHSSGVLDINGTTDSSSAAGTNGAIQCAGGVSIAKNLYVGTSGTSAKMVFDGNGGVDFNGSGAITMDAGAASNLTTSAGDLTLQSGASVNIISTEAAADAILLRCSNAAGGIDVDANGGGFDLDSSGAITLTSTKDAVASIYLHTNAGTAEQIKIHCDQGNKDASIYLLSDDGGIDLTTSSDKPIELDSAGDVNIFAAGDGGISVGTQDSGCPVSIGHTTSETTVNDNLSITGTSTFTGAPTINNTVTVNSYTGTAAGGGIDAVSPTIKVQSLNGIVTTRVFIDIGAGSILSSGSSGDVIGEDGVANAYLTRLTTAVNGLVYAGYIICLEVPTTGDDDINVAANSSGTIAEDAAGEGEHVLANCGEHTLGLKTAFTIPAGGIVNDYIYLTHGDTTAGTYNAGKFLLVFEGYIP